MGYIYIPLRVNIEFQRPMNVRNLECSGRFATLAEAIDMSINKYRKT